VKDIGANLVLGIELFV